MPDCFYFDFNACYLVINACMNARNAVVAFTHGIRTLPVYTLVISHYITNAQIYSLDSSSVPSDRTKKSSRIQCAHQKICIRASTFFFGRLAYTVFNFIIFIGCCSFLFRTSIRMFRFNHLSYTMHVRLYLYYANYFFSFHIFIRFDEIIYTIIQTDTNG